MPHNWLARITLSGHTSLTPIVLHYIQLPVLVITSDTDQIKADKSSKLNPQLHQLFLKYVDGVLSWYIAGNYSRKTCLTFRFLLISLGDKIYLYFWGYIVGVIIGFCKQINVRVFWEGTNNWNPLTKIYFWLHRESLEFWRCLVISYFASKSIKKYTRWRHLILWLLLQKR